MAGLHFDITADNTNLIQKLKETENRIKSASKVVEQEGGSIEDLFSRMTRAVAAFGAGFTAKELIQNVIRVRGEFQQLEVAFNTMLGSQEKATSLMSQLTETAAKTPFDLQGVANGARQLLAYGTAAEDVNETLIRLGNIAAGLSIPLNDLVYLYGTTMTQGRLYTQDLNQFTGRGIPMIKELAKEFGVAESEIKAMVEAGKIGFPEVQKVIQNLTNEGGMFYNLMQEQSKTITGQISNIGDSFSMMLNEIGKANEGIINDTLGGVSYLIENYETVGKTLLEIVGTYGAYKAALITITALQKAYSAVLAQSALNQSLAAASGVTLSNAQALAATRTKLLQIAQAALNKTLLANPYVAAATAVAVLGLGIYKLITYQTEAEKAQQRLNDAINESKKEALSEQLELARLKGELSTLTEGTEEYNTVKEKIIKGYGKYYDGLEEEINRVGLTEEAYNRLTEAITRSFGARQYEKYKSEQEGILDETMSNNLIKIQDRLIEKLGNEAGAKYYAKIRDALISGNVSVSRNNTGGYQVIGIDNDTQKALDKAAGKDGGLFDVTNRAIEGYMENILKAIKATDELDQLARERFGITSSKTISKRTDSTFSVESKSISQLEEEIGKAQTRLESLKKAFADGSGTKEAVEQQEAYIKSLQDTVLEREKDLKVISEVEAQISKLKKEQKETTYGSKEYNSLQKRIDALDAKLPQTKSERNEEEKEKEARQRLADELLELQRKNQERETALMKEGTEKRLKQIDDDYEAQKAAIEKKQREWSSKNKELGVTDTNINGLTYEQQTEIDRANSLNNSERQKQAKDIYKAEREAMYQYLKEYGTYQEKRLAITQEYQQKIAESGGADTWQGKLLQKQMGNELADMEENAGKVSSAIGRLFGDMSVKTVDEMRSIADEADRMLTYIEDGEFKTDSNGKPLFGISEEWFNRLKESPEELASIKNEIQNVRNEADKAEPTFNKIKRLLDDIFNNNDGKTPLEEKLQSLFAEINKALQAARFLSDTFANLGDAFGSSALSGVAEGLNVAVGSIESAMQGASAAASLGLGGIGAAAGAAVGLVSSLAGAIAKIHDKKNEKRIQRLQDQIDTLDKSYDKLGRSVEEAYSKDASNLIEQQNKLLEQQKLLIEQQIKEEQAKKKSDDLRIKEWQQQLEEINQAIEDNKEKAMDAIFGEDLQSAIENFASAYAEAWASGEDRAQSAKDTVKKMMQQMVTESIKAAIRSSSAMEDIRQKLQQFYADNVLSGWEQDYIYNMAEELQKELDEQFGWADSLMGGDKKQQSATSRGFETMAQDQSSELIGRFTALFEVGLQIYNTLQLIQTITVSVNEQNSVLFEIRNLIISSNGYLEDISGLQKRIYELLNGNIPQISNHLNKL